MSHPVPPPVLSPVVYEPILRRALHEDLGCGGDLTTDALVAPGTSAMGRIVARSPGCIAGLDVSLAAFRLLAPDVVTHTAVGDGDAVGADTLLGTVAGPAAALLSGERTALNLLAHLSGIATVTRLLVDAISGQDVRIADTRKTTPGLRALEKYAVRVGGGSNHRFGLDDAVLVKDNHLAICADVGEAVRRVRSAVGHLVAVEVEVDSLEQLDEALSAGADAVLLDNMGVEEMRLAVARVDGRATVEASGGIRPERVAEVATTGVDVISLGWITQSAPALDVAFEVVSGDGAVG